MNICIVSEEFPPLTDNGGIASVSVNLAKGLEKSGHKVSVITKAIGDNRYQYNYHKNQKIRVYRTNINFNNKLLNFFYFRFPLGVMRRIARLTFPIFWNIIEWNVAAYLQFKEIHKQERITVVHTPDFHLGGLFILMLTKVPVMVQLHGWRSLIVVKLGRAEKTIEGALIDLLEKFYVKRSSGYFVVSKSLGTLAKKWLNTKDLPKVIYNSVDKTAFFPQEKIEQSRRILYVGRFEKKKGVDLLLLAFIKLAEEYKDIQLLFVGRDTETFPMNRQMVSFRKYVSSLEIPIQTKRRIQLIKHKPHSQLLRFYQQASFCVFPSHFEPFSMTLLEASACGKAVIASNRGGAGEFIRDGKNGLLIEPNVEAIIKKAELLIKHPNYRNKLGVAACKTVRKHHGIKKISRQVHAFYTKCIAK